MNRWKGNTQDKTGVATFEADGQHVEIPLQSFEHYHALLRVIESERRRSLKAQAAFLRGAVSRVFDQE